jgi:hypothetical protein
MSKGNGIKSGETKGARAAIDRMTKQLVSSGMDSQKARNIARDQAVKADRRNGKG